MKTLSFTSKVKRFLPLFALLSISAQTVDLPVVATAQEINGILKISRAGQVVNGERGQSFFPGDELQTGPADKALLQFVFGETQIKMAGDTRLLIAEPNTAQVFLSKGLMWGKKTKESAAFLIQTPVMTTAVRGTEFFIRVDSPDQALVLVKEGVLEIDFEGRKIKIGPLTLGFFQKGVGTRLSPIHNEVLKDWAASFETEASFFAR